MTTYYMLRSFDHAGYYETRLILMFVAAGLASWLGSATAAVTGLQLRNPTSVE